MITAEPRPTSQSLASDGPSRRIAITSDAEVRARVDEARDRLLREAGLVDDRKQYRRTVELPFTKTQRDNTTLLFGGLTWKHEQLIHGAWEGLGYKCEVIPTPDVKAFQLGKEYGNNGQCNPTYFTVGNLVQYLQKLREDDGMSTTRSTDKLRLLDRRRLRPLPLRHVRGRVPAGAAQRRLRRLPRAAVPAVGRPQPVGRRAGLEMNLDFFLGMLNAMMMGDLVNEVAYQIRPYEVNPGDTDRVLDESMEHLQDVCRQHQPWTMEQSRVEPLPRRRSRRRQSAPASSSASSSISCARRATTPRPRTACSGASSQVPVDYTRFKPIVKITGEFWAQTTEGDGNFNMFRFLEREGARGAGRADRDLDQVHDPPGAHEDPRSPRPQGRRSRARAWRSRASYARRDGLPLEASPSSAFAETVFKREYDRMRERFGGTCHALADQPELQRIGHPFYNSRAGGGEGHLEVAKNIYYTNHEPRAHGAVGEAVRLHAVDAVGRRAVGGGLQVQGPDLPARSRPRAKARSTPTAACRWRSAKPSSRPRTSSRAPSNDDRLHLEEIQAYVAAHPELKQPLLPRAARYGPDRRGRRTSSRHVGGADAAGRPPARRRPRRPRAPRRSRELAGGRGMVTAPIKFVRQSIEAARAGRTPRPARPPARADSAFMIGLDVGSTTVKAVVVDAATDEILWSGLPAPRHQAAREGARVPAARSRPRPASTPENTSASSSPARAAAGWRRSSGAKFVQEVNAVSLAVEKLYPEAGSVIELGGQDAKIIVFKADAETGQEEEDPVDERQVRRRHRRGHRQDQRQAAHPGRPALPAWATTGSSCIRWPASAASSPRPTSTACRSRACRRRAHGVAVRVDRAAEPVGADARQHAAAGRAAARRPQHLHPGHARGLAAQHPEDVGGAQRPAPGGRRSRPISSRCRRTAQYFAASARCEFGKTEELEVGRYTGWHGTRALHHGRARRGEGGQEGRRRRRLGEGRGRARARSSERYQREPFAPATLPARPGRARASSASTAARPPPRPSCMNSRHAAPRQGVPALEGQSDRGHDRHVPPAPRAGRVSRARPSRCSASAPPATPRTS